MDRISNTALLFVVAVFVALSVYVFLDRERVARWFAADIIGKETNDLNERILALEEELSAEKEKAESAVQSVEDKIDTVFRSAFGPQVTCEQLVKGLGDLSDYLDNRIYIAEDKHRSGAYGRLKTLAEQLTDQTPVVMNETENLLLVLKNTAHFYRVLGSKDLGLINAILLNESESIESMFELLYRIVETEGKCASSGVDLRIPFHVTYLYAAFFLDTLGGGSYLMRRDAKVRMLVQYYSILVVDIANRKGKNYYEIVMHRPIGLLIRDMQWASGLKYRDTYLVKLHELQEKYRSLYGMASGE